MVESERFAGLHPAWHHEQCFFEKELILSLDLVKGWKGVNEEDRARIQARIAQDDVASKVEEGLANAEETEMPAPKRSKGNGGDDGRALSSLTVVELRKRLSDVGSDPRGLKAVLIKRLRDTEETRATVNPPMNASMSLSSSSSSSSSLAPSLPSSPSILQFEEQLKQESKSLWAIVDALKPFSSTELKALLDLNLQNSTGGIGDLRKRTADCMLYGSLKQCVVCEGETVYRDGAYRCTGELQWGSCTWNEVDVERAPWMMRVAVKNKEGKKKKNAKGQPSEASWEDVRFETLAKFLDDFPRQPKPVAAHQWKSAQMRTVKQAVFAQEEMQEARVDTRRAKSGTAGLNKSAKVLLKGRAEVDEQLAAEAHVVELDGDKHDVILNMTDVAKGLNSYYKLQLLKHDTKKKWFVFRKWGRVGTRTGDDRLEEFRAERTALARFSEEYLRLTGNEWSARAAFEKKPGGFYPVDVCYGMDDTEDADEARSGESPSVLDPRVQAIVSAIFDKKMMSTTLLELQIDAARFPLGKLSQGRILEGFEVLAELQAILESDEKGKEELLLGTSNKFYTIIPHIWKRHRPPPVLASLEQIQAKSDTLEALREMAAATTLRQEALTKV
jgi:predicted DNA-binding WGR domain protein